ncbi:17624_t:CDS:2 [Funneliformis geosporum]|uniref:17624_t:CDS:1 n=1 Tax=Funneliformis geosporum TaxID=1117311 RepID=A0A9W4SZ36_9GLOM|nr:17624_t:CDS:2 [Funneliformis geosporum]
MDAFINESTLTFLKAYRNENIRVIDNKFQPLLGKSVEYLYDPNSGAKAMQIGYELLQQGKRVAFILTSCSIVQVLAEKASKLQRPDNSSIRACELDCVAYTSTVEAGISFEKIDHFDAVIGITNIVTPVNVEAFIQIMFQIRYKNIRAELKNARSNDLPTAIRGHRESSTDASFQLIKIDKSQEVIENRKRICNEVRVKVLVIKKTDFEAVATFWNLDPKEAENLKFDQERSISNTMKLKCFYMRNIYGGFTGIDDKHILSGSIISESFKQSCERFIEI